MKLKVATLAVRLGVPLHPHGARAWLRSKLKAVRVQARTAPSISPLLISAAPSGPETARALDFSATATARATRSIQSDGTSAIRLAAIAPVDLLHDLSHEPITLHALSPDAPEFEAKAYDLLLVMPDGQRYDDGWQAEFVSQDGRLSDVLRSAREAALPVVVWRTAEPIHADKLTWLDEYADLVCRTGSTLEIDVVESENALACAPLFQPRAFNPFIDAADADILAESETNIFLDGWWTATNSLQRDPDVIALKPGLSIVDSAWEHAAFRQDDNAQYRRNSLGCISVADRALVAKFWDQELFVEDETLSPNMLRKRAREAIGANCCPVTFSSELHERLLGDLVSHREPMLMGVPDRDAVVEMLRRRAAMHVARRKMLAEATYDALLAAFAEKCGLGHRASPPPLVSVVLVSRRPRLAAACLEKVRGQTHSRIEFIYVLHGRHSGDEEVLERMRSGGAITLQFDQTFSLGACINAAVKSASGDFIAKMDDDDFYGPNYIADLISYEKCIDFDFIGKPSGFYQNAADDRLYFDRNAFRREWRYSGPDTGRVLAAGAAMMVRRGVFDKVRYPETRRGGADSEFSRQCQRAGIVTYSADLFNFVVYRDADPAFHTWRLAETHMRTLLDVSDHFTLTDVMI